MLFLIEYDRVNARRVYYEEFSDEQRSAAQEARFRREVVINRAKVEHEVVLLEAPSVDALRKTHARYFDDISEMLERLGSSTSAHVVRERKD